MHNKNQLKIISKMLVFEHLGMHKQCKVLYNLEIEEYNKLFDFPG